MMEAITVFFATYVTVFALGFQSRNVNTHQYIPAALTSIVIGATHLVLYKMLPDAGIETAVAFLIAGSMGITSSMYVHDRWMMKKAKPNVCRKCGFPSLVLGGMDYSICRKRGNHSINAVVSIQDWCQGCRENFETKLWSEVTDEKNT